MSDKKLMERIEKLENDTKTLTNTMLIAVNLFESINESVSTLHKQIDKLENKDLKK